MSKVKTYDCNMPETLNFVFSSVMDELIRATNKHGPLNSTHEAYAVILEELDEFWEEVRKKREERSPMSMLTELIQIAAVTIRAIIDLELVQTCDDMIDMAKGKNQEDRDDNGHDSI